MFDFFKKKEKKSINLDELAKRLANNRSVLGKGRGKSYWKSQAQISLDYFRELDIIKK